VESWPKRLEEAYYKDPKVRQIELGEGVPPKDTKPVQFRGDPDINLPHVANWIESIRTRKPHWEDASAGHHAAACAHMVNMSVETGRTVEWDFAKDDIKKRS
jgi:hypothetical protein